MSNPYTSYVKGSEESKARLLYILDIQAQHMRHWESVLNEEAFGKLSVHVREFNNKVLGYIEDGVPFVIEREIIRGADLTGVIANMNLTN